MTEHTSKQAVRERVYDRLNQRKQGAFPFPLEGRIPNFKGSRQAGRRLAKHPLFRKSKTVKVNPDAPQQAVREAVLQNGKTLYMPAPRLKRGFMRFDPERIPEGEIRRAVTLSHYREYAQEVSVSEMDPIDLFVCGSVAVTRDGKRAGKGHGYSDLEYASLQMIGQRPMPVATTVHELQIVTDLALDRHDIHLQLIVTPEQTLDTPATLEDQPRRIDWEILSSEDIEAMPLLAELRQTFS